MRKILCTLCAFIFLCFVTSTGHAELIGSLGGVPFKPAAVKLMNAGGMVYDEVAYDTYRLIFRNVDDIFAPQSATVTIALPKGKLPDGGTFRKLANTPTEKQPSLVEGLPEVQGWKMEEKESGLQLSSVFSNQGSVQVVFGKRQGTTISGTINLNVPTDPADGPDTKPSSLVGDFSAVIESE